MRAESLALGALRAPGFRGAARLRLACCTAEFLARERGARGERLQLGERQLAAHRRHAARITSYNVCYTKLLRVNDSDVIVIKSVVGIGAGEHVSTEVVYTMVKTFWENIGGESKGTPWLRALSRDDVFEQVNAKLP